MLSALITGRNILRDSKWQWFRIVKWNAGLDIRLIAIKMHVYEFLTSLYC